MGVTISTHNGSKVARQHNLRNEKVTCKEAHITQGGHHETWLDEDLKDAYDRIFGEALKEYNDNQKRANRKIDSYYKQVCKDQRKHEVYEMIIGVYGKDKQGNPICSKEQGREIMKDFVDGWKRRNPSLEIIGAYYHADEQGEPHCHIDYVPVGTNYIRGMKKQNGLLKALGSMGLEKEGKITAQMKWQWQENKHLENLCRERGLEVDHPREQGRKHLETEEYKIHAVMKEEIARTEEVIREEKGKQEKAIKETMMEERKRNKALDEQIKITKRNLRWAGKKDAGCGMTMLEAGEYRKVKESIKAMQEDAKAIKKTDLDVMTKLEDAERLKNLALTELYEAREEAKQIIEEAMEQKEKLIQEGERYAGDQAKLIDLMAGDKFNDFKKQLKKGQLEDRLERLEDMCSKINAYGGGTLLDVFEEKEKEYFEDLEKEWEDYSESLEVYKEDWEV